MSRAQQPNDDVWEQIAEKVDQLDALWSSLSPDDSAPSISPLLTDVHDRFKRLVACELVKFDLEQRWRSRCHPQHLESYVDEIPELGRLDDLPADLIYEEFQIRLQAGDVVTADEIERRFPSQSEDLKRLIGSSAQPGTPSVSLKATLSRASTHVPQHSTSLDQLQEGDSVDDFDLLLLLGSGSFAKVFLARQRSLERLVALKISKDVGSEPRTLAQLDHPNIVRVFDVRTCEIPGTRLLYMELVPGGTLRDVIIEAQDATADSCEGKLLLDVIDANLAASGTAPPHGSEIRRELADANWGRVVCLLGFRLALGLSYAHEKGVLHRDIKPANVLLTSEGMPKLADFNISFQGGREDENPEDTFGGSMAYMSPEQLEACHPLLGGSPAKVRHASDIYSLGVLLFEVATLRRPFDDASTSPSNSNWALSIQRMIDVRKKVDVVEDLVRNATELPAPLGQVLQKCLQPEPANRFASARDLAFSLYLCLHQRCWDLLQPPQSWLGRLSIRFPVLTILLATLLPSVFAAIFNFVYNKAAIAEQFDAAGEETLMRVQMVINGIAFPIGIAIVIWVARKCAHSVFNDAVPPKRFNALATGIYMAIVALSLWAMAGLAYPISFEWLIEGGVGLHVYVHFFLSLLLCGAVAATYPFFLVSFFCLRYLIPVTIRREASNRPTSRELNLLRQANRWFLGLTGLVPLLGILLILIGNQNIAGAHRDMIVASLAGLFGFILMFWLHRVIDDDISAFEQLGRYTTPQ